MRNLMVIVLIAMLLGLMLPASNLYFDTQQAFTSDNLIRLNLVYK